MLGLDQDTFLFVVDTDNYAGNFEREMCAFMTGVIGECEVGEREAKEFFEEFDEKFEDIIISSPDEHGCNRPVEIWPTPLLSNNGSGGVEKVSHKSEIKYSAYYSIAISSCRSLTDSEIEFLKDRAYKYASNNEITITGFRKVICKVTHTEEEIEI